MFEKIENGIRNLGMLGLKKAVFELSPKEISDFEKGLDAHYYATASAAPQYNVRKGEYRLQLTYMGILVIIKEKPLQRVQV